MTDRLIVDVRVVRKYALTGAELRRLRIAGDLSEEQLAGVMGVSRKQVQRLQSRAVIELGKAELEVLLEAVGAVLK